LQEKRAKQILMIAPSLLGESLALQLTSEENSLEIILENKDLIGLPKLILICLEDIELTNPIKLEIQRLKQKWVQTPILLVIPRKIKLSSNDLITLGSEGVIQDPTIKDLNETINVLLDGGRIFKINQETNHNYDSIKNSYGLGYWLLTSGLSQINKDLNSIEYILRNKAINPFYLFVILGRRRELLTAKKLLLWLWGPLEILIESPSKNNSIKSKKQSNKYNTDITIPNTSIQAIWGVIYKTLDEILQDEISNPSDELLALFSLNRIRRVNLLKTLLNEFNNIINKLAINENKDIEKQLGSRLESFTPELRANTLRNFVDPYDHLIKNGINISITEFLVKNSKLDIQDDEMPSIDLILNPILKNKPILLEGKYLSIEDPRSLIHMEMLVLNWLFRTAELISGELISLCSEWSELRKYLLNKQLISTRELERRRNQINTRNQLQDIFKKPIRLYESKRTYYTVTNNQINKIILTEPRDEELKNLEWPQRQIAFIIELRDALAPQIQAIIQYLGDLIVLILTKVVGRSIGLIGRGIAQGMGKSLTKG
tara:strand:+ start:1526 stop:3163 length:1638 start_codon:yes stop_codon:yes gene_type:complete